jgi:methyl-accepting chemotaxis protein
MRLGRSYRDASVALKIALPPLLGMLCLVAVVALALWSNASLMTALTRIKASTLPELQVTNQIQRRAAAISESINKSLAWTGAEYPQPRIDALDKDIAHELGAIDDFLKQQQSNPLWNDDARAKLQQIDKAFAGYRKAAADVLDVKTSGLPNAGSFIDAMETSYLELDHAVAALAASCDEASTAVATRTEAAAHQRTIGILLAAGLALGLAGVATWIGTVAVTRPLHQAVVALQRVAAGDLSVDSSTDRHDELGELLGALQTTVASLRTLVSQVHGGVKSVTTASAEIAAGNGDLSARTEQQATALQQTAASMMKLTDTLRTNSDHAHRADQLAVGASDAATRGGDVVDKVVVTMQEIAATSRQISEIIGVIDGIAFQTNILALNAAVEAARAGEQGRGFAVVAGEVRTLAQRSATAARETRSLISASAEKVEAGSQQVAGAGAAMSGIVSKVNEVSRLIADIARASAEQGKGLNQVNSAITQIDRATQQNAALVEENAAAAQSVADQARTLADAVAVFKLTAG